jgi:hypothetical protein
MTEGSDGFGEGRFVDPLVGALGGEAAEQKVPATAESRGRTEGAEPFEVWPGVPGTSQRDGTTYYERPVLKEPVWLWAIPAYF